MDDVTFGVQGADENKAEQTVEAQYCEMGRLGNAAHARDEMR